MQRNTEPAVRLGSGADAAFALQLAGITVSRWQIQHIALGIGAELAQQRDE